MFWQVIAAGKSVGTRGAFTEGVEAPAFELSERRSAIQTQAAGEGPEGTAVRRPLPFSPRAPTSPFALSPSKGRCRAGAPPFALSLSKGRCGAGALSVCPEPVEGSP